MKIELNETNIKIICKLNYFFNDFKNVETWLRTDNINFGGISPCFLMSIDRSNKILQFIEATLDEIEEIETALDGEMTSEEYNRKLEQESLEMISDMKLKEF